MSDEADEANELAEASASRAITAARAAVLAMPVGAPGECALCGEESGRLVRGACAPCRDRRGLA